MREKWGGGVERERERERERGREREGEGERGRERGGRERGREREGGGREGGGGRVKTRFRQGFLESPAPPVVGSYFSAEEHCEMQGKIHSCFCSNQQSGLYKRTWLRQLISTASQYIMFTTLPILPHVHTTEMSNPAVVLIQWLYHIVRSHLDGSYPC